jgi:hypothetical protein
MRSFEIQIYKDRKWKMNSVYDDLNLAIDEAKRVDEGCRYAGVRVIEDNYDEATNQTTSRTLFSGGAAKTEKSKKPGATAKPKSTGPRTGTGREPVRKSGAKATAKKSKFLVPVLVLLVVFLGGLVALFGLQQIASLK